MPIAGASATNAPASPAITTEAVLIGPGNWPNCFSNSVVALITGVNAGNSSVPTVALKSSSAALNCLVAPNAPPKEASKSAAPSVLMRFNASISTWLLIWPSDASFFSSPRFRPNTFATASSNCGVASLIALNSSPAKRPEPSAWFSCKVADAALAAFTLFSASSVLKPS